jgi:hypothetical protein
MAFVAQDRIHETSTVTGTGNATLLGAITQPACSPFSSVMNNGDTCFYCISQQNGTQWECGLGTFVSATPALARTTVIDNSLQTTALINFTAGTKDVELVLLASQALLSQNNLSDIANAGTARTSLGLAIGTNVQAFSAVLTALASVMSATATAAAQRTALGLGTASVQNVAFFAQAANNLSDVANALTAFGNISPMTTLGDLLVQGASNALRLGIGSSGQVLTVVGGTAAWAAAGGGGGGGLSFVNVTGTTQAMATLTRYLANNAGLVTLTLPTAAALGDQMIVQGNGGGGWKMAQSTVQMVFFGTKSTTSGATGSLASTNQYDSVTLTCVVAPVGGTGGQWSVQQSQGNITVV